ncbi:MAG: hypothetical protein WAT39_22195 [Planctomycetota bacterium]
MNPSAMLLRAFSGLTLSLSLLTSGLAAQGLLGPGYPAGSPCNGLGLPVTVVGGALAGGVVSIGAPLPVQANPWVVVTAIGPVLPMAFSFDPPWHTCPHQALLWVMPEIVDLQIVGVNGNGVTTLTIPVAPWASGFVFGAQRALGVVGLRMTEARWFVL